MNPEFVGIVGIVIMLASMFLFQLPVGFIKESCILHRDADLVADGGQEFDLLIGELAGAPG